MAPEQTLSKYEMMIVVKALLPDDVRNKTLDDVKKIIADKGGSIKDTDIWGKKYLAYKIQGHSEGYYVVYKIELPPEEVSEVNTELGRLADLLRFIVLKDGEGQFETKVGKKGSVLAFDQDIKD
ncbi:30S ribosomal protein S6 [Candidatus Woesebacteria bacterium]|nr:30S ribosomal protein S6 [Candidatus Woesebacteria bacterium]